MKTDIIICAIDKTWPADDQLISNNGFFVCMNVSYKIFLSPRKAYVREIVWDISMHEINSIV